MRVGQQVRVRVDPNYAHFKQLTSNRLSGVVRAATPEAVLLDAREEQRGAVWLPRSAITVEHTRRGPRRKRTRGLRRFEILPGGVLSLSFPQVPEMVSALQRIGSVTWDKSLKRWIIPDEHASALLTFIDQFNFSTDQTDLQHLIHLIRDQHQRSVDP
jgi:hypothetical protein